MKKFIIAFIVLFCVIIPGCERGDCTLCDSIRDAFEPNQWEQAPYESPAPPSKVKPVAPHFKENK